MTRTIRSAALAALLTLGTVVALAQGAPAGAPEGGPGGTGGRAVRRRVACRAVVRR